MRSYSDILSKFTEILDRINPMNLQAPGDKEYEQEALSILSRFTETSLNLADEDQALQAAEVIVKLTFEFWFTDIATMTSSDIVARELLHVFCDRKHPHQEEEDFFEISGDDLPQTD